MKTNLLLPLILAAIAGLVMFDIYGDIQTGTTAGHVAVEVFVAILAIAGLVSILATTWRLQKKIDVEISRREAALAAAESWRQEAGKFIEGLGKAIDAQLKAWHLTPAEKEVAFLLLKGLSIKEIAGVCGKSDRTVRVQSAAIYEKSGLGGRSELAAFFLEDLLTARPESGVR